jgi:hypothetical protein
MTKINWSAKDLIDLTDALLKNRSFNASIDGMNPVVIYLMLETVKGLILRPVLFTIFVSPLFDIIKLTAFEDGTFIPKWNHSMRTLTEDMEKTLEAITKWLNDSGLKVNN